MIKVRFITEKDPVSWLIRKWTWSDWSHVDFLFDKSELGPAGYLGARPTKGVELRPLDYCKPSKWAIGQIDCDDKTSYQIERWARNQEGTPYDYAGVLLGFSLHHDFNRIRHWFCSHMVAYGCELYGKPILDLPIELTDRLSPGALAMSPEIKIILRSS